MHKVAWRLGGQCSWPPWWKLQSLSGALKPSEQDSFQQEGHIQFSTSHTMDHVDLPHSTVQQSPHQCSNQSSVPWMVKGSNPWSWRLANSDRFFSQHGHDRLWGCMSTKHIGGRHLLFLDGSSLQDTTTFQQLKSNSNSLHMTHPPCLFQVFFELQESCQDCTLATLLHSVLFDQTSLLHLNLTTQ